ncbi:MAG: ASKHA domain-containing protein [Dissulfurispiraceae bacterium]|jgi:uncharacterized 2Fe-2S/4Fe-4S cluster protein (DUF4445 family)|nr:ASKHA domain-containing protein [Dissulfurispiraceae bacterium]
MQETIRLLINPCSKVVKAKKGDALIDVFVSAGIEIPVLCNKNGSCGKCRVVVKADANPVSEIERLSLGDALLQKGYRLACRTEVWGDGEVTVPVESSEEALESIYSGDEIQVIKNKRFNYPLRPQVASGYSAALDLGTTTITGYLFDSNGNLLSYCSCFNPTTLYGGDVMTRMTYIQGKPENFLHLRSSLFTGIKKILSSLCIRALGFERGIDIQDECLQRIAVCGNTFMQHVFLGLNPVEIGLFPHRPLLKDSVKAKAGDISGLVNAGVFEQTEVLVAPAVDSFIGGDAVCGAIATMLHKSSEPAIMIDLGTNGEMVLNNNGHLFAASASAGPAFEGYQISAGMRATVGAINSINIDEDHTVHYNVIGGIKPKGICGTGIVSSIAELIRTDLLTETGHIKKGHFCIVPEGESFTGSAIVLTDKDVEVVQKAKAAFSSGIFSLLRTAGLGLQDLKRIYLAGAFGSRASKDDLKGIGLIPYEINAEVIPSGNSAGAGIAMLLLSESAENEAIDLARKINVVEFVLQKEFEDEYLNALFFKKYARNI